MYLNEMNFLNANESKLIRKKRMSPFKNEDPIEFTSHRININHCIEYSPFIQSRLVYSYASFVIQYTLPILLVLLAYGNIWWKLKKHRKNLKSYQRDSKLMQKKTHNQSEVYQSTTSNLLESNKKNIIEAANSNIIDKATNQTTIDKKRRLKMNLLLVFIAIIFAASWLPLNLFNILSDTKNSIIKADHTFYIVNAICILFAMSSAVSNPCLYGVLNENFKREYVKLFYQILSKFSNCCRNNNSSRSNVPSTANEFNSFSKCEDNLINSNKTEIRNKSNGSANKQKDAVEFKNRSISNIEDIDKSGEKNIWL
jgi:hypothetical protein